MNRVAPSAGQVWLTAFASHRNSLGYNVSPQAAASYADKALEEYQSRFNEYGGRLTK